MLTTVANRRCGDGMAGGNAGGRLGGWEFWENEKPSLQEVLTSAPTVRDLIHSND